MIMNMLPVISAILLLALTTAILPTPEVIPVLRIQLDISKVETLFRDKTRDLEYILTTISSGNITTIENERGFSMQVDEIAGFGKINSYLSTEYATIDNVLHGKTPDGTDIEFKYEGMASCLGSVSDMIERGDSDIFDCQISITPRFTIHSKEHGISSWLDQFSFLNPESYLEIGSADSKNKRWVEMENLIGKGRVYKSGGTLCGEYTVFILR